MLKHMTLNAIVKYIEDNLENKPISTECLVSYSGFSRRYLQLLFKEHLGISVGKYIQLRRVSRAAVLLKYTNLALSHIAENLFYDSQQTFTREFKKNTGHTPLQYRKNEIWTFDNLTGKKKLPLKIPPADIRFMERKRVSGVLEKYTESIPYTGINSELRWRHIEARMSESAGPLHISNRVMAGCKKNSEIEINSIYWSKGENKNEEIILPAGHYACFRFTGNRADYIQYINNIYMSVLPYYGIQKKGEYDMEIISRDDNGDFVFEYYLPVMNPVP
ncbi:helix-turn-helix domain-containing protein [Escherichia coli]|nr:helix-turn-helix domain-containing protein [Escherichia coli]